MNATFLIGIKGVIIALLFHFLPPKNLLEIFEKNQYL